MQMKVEEKWKIPLVPYEQDVTRKYTVKYNIKRQYASPIDIIKCRQTFEEEFYNHDRKKELDGLKGDKLLSAEERQTNNRIKLKSIMDA